MMQIGRSKVVKLIIIIALITGCTTIERMAAIPFEDDPPEPHVFDDEIGVRTHSKTFRPSKMIEVESKVRTDVMRIQRDVVKGFGIPPHMIDFEYEIEQRKDGRIEITVTGSIKDYYKKQFRQMKLNLLRQLEGD